MARKKVVDSAKLIKAVESGLPAKEIMSMFGFKTRLQLKSFYLDALVEKGKAKSIISRIPKKTEQEKKIKAIKVNKRGSLVVTRGMVEEMGFAIGDAFSIRKTKSGISLRKR
ncbi:MAG: hypothetical protein JRG97_07915 [Deltaproteobacteria bacterium]|nr:hypothetical protein [Deltaproteobacteria bacterium]MBW2052685.1 hypothetical protein [Deltaproteobacteria bacterium]MBW2140983.1 hypothetical protein [Deltaproteobacteria bacterium]MBW2323152.1 hypothetical protein [Deltaproteobacteria bacterium]